MNKVFVYGISYEAAPGLLATAGAPAGLIVTRDGMQVSEGDLENARIFVLSKLKGRYVLSLAASVRSAAELMEGSLQGAYLLELFPELSIQTTNLERAEAWVVNDVSVPEGGLIECSTELEQLLLSRLRSNWNTRTAMPSSPSSPRVLSGQPNGAMVQDAIVKVLRTRPLDSMERHVGHRNLSPIGSEAFRAIKLVDERHAEILLQLLEAYDPLINGGTHVSPGLLAQRIVDTSLVAIDPDIIVPRRFIESEHREIRDQRLERLERSEFVHQRTVRLLARGLIHAGFVPMASRSVDLAFQAPDALVIIEVKSVNQFNFDSQLLSAIGQVLLYESQLLQDSVVQSVRGVVVLACEGSLMMGDWCGWFARRANVGLYQVTVSPADETPLYDLARKIA